MSIEERVAVLEAITKDVRETQKEVNEKLDKLLGYKDRGLGAFWLVSTIFGAGIIGFITTIVSWVQGRH